MKKRFRTANLISIFIVSVLLILPSSVCAAPQAETDVVSQAEPERFGTAQWYSTYSPGTILTDSFYYSDDWFLSDPEERNDALALISMQLTAAAVENDEQGTGTVFLEKLGFEQTGLAGFEEADPNGCNYTWGTKTIGTGDSAFTLAAIIIQSHSSDQTAKQIGWRQNFLLNPETLPGEQDPEALPGEQASYAAAADYAAEKIAALPISGNVKYWVMGQSRGGAVAGILAVRLKTEESSVYAYTFESPANVEQPFIQAQEQDYGYIHNYLCSDDVVTMIPPWGMTRYGTEHLLNTPETTEGLLEILEKIGSGIVEIAGDYDSDTIRGRSENLIRALSGRIPSREEYSAIQNDVFTDASGNEIRISYRWQDLFAGLMQIVFGDVFQGVDTDRLMDDLPQLVPVVSSLYTAVKEDSDSSYYETAVKLGKFLEQEEINLPLTTEEFYALLKLAGPVLTDTEYVPASEEFTSADLVSCLTPAIELFADRNLLIFSHQFDTIIARLKVLAKEPEIGRLTVSMPQPQPGEDVASLAVMAQEAFDQLGYSWLQASAEWDTGDLKFLDNKAYYLRVHLSSAGHSIPDGFQMTVNGEVPAEPVVITYADGVTDITGTWKCVLGTPEQVQVSLDMNGHGEAQELLYPETGEKLSAVLPDLSSDLVTDSTGTYRFGGWYDENGVGAESLFAGQDMTLYAEWNQVINDIEIHFDIPQEGQETSAPYVNEDAPYQVNLISLLDEEWNEITGIQGSESYILNLEISPASQNIEFLTDLNEDGDETYAGVLSVNGEEVESWYDASENVISATYYFTAQE